VLLSHRHDVRVLELGAFTSNTAKAQAHAIVSGGALDQGRKASFVDAGTPVTIATAFANGSADVFLVDALEDMSIGDAISTGGSLGPGLAGFLGGGGVVVIWTTPKAATATKSFLATTSLLDVSSIPSETGPVVVSDWLDALSANEPSPFLPTGAALGFVVSTPPEPTMSFVIKAADGEPVVVHRVYPPI